MADNGFVLLDTKAFDAALEKKQALINSYNELNNDYDRIVSTLLASWKGRGATAFAQDAQTVKKNIMLYNRLLLKIYQVKTSNLK